MNPLTSYFSRLWYSIMSKHNDESTREVLEELRHLRHEIRELKKHIMIALDNLTANVTALTTGVTELTLAVDTAITDITSPTANDAAIQVQADAVAALTTTISSDLIRNVYC